MAAVVGSDRPEVAFVSPRPGSSRRRGLVHEQTIRRGQMTAHVVTDGLEMEAGAA